MPITKADQNVIETSICTTDTAQTITGSKNFSNLSGNISSATALATGSTTARTLANRFSDVVNVKDFGAVGTGAVDDRPFIQAAIDASYGKTLFFPDGTYLISSELIINSASNFVGSGPHTFIATNGNAIVINPGGGLTMQNFVIFKSGNSTTLTTGILANSGGISLNKVSLLNFPLGLELRGVNNCSFIQLTILNAFGQTSTVAGSCCLKISNDTNPDGEFTHYFTSCFFSASFVNEFAINIEHGDVSYFSNCYIAAAKIANVFIENRNTTVNSAKSFDNCYIDGVSFPTPSTPATPYGIWIKNDGQLSNIPLVNFRNCHIGQNYIGAFIDEPSSYQISFNNCEIFNCWEAGIQSSSSDIDLRINGCSFNNIGTVTANGESILIRDGKSINITSNIFRVGDNPPVATFYGIKLEGTIEQACIDGNCFLGIPNDYNSTATVNQLLIADNISNNPTNTIVGSIIGNQANSNPKSLDWYEETTFSPVISFGGASVGVTYSGRSGSLTRIGNRVLVNIYIALSNKGTSTGTALIGTLPFAVNNSYPAQFTVLCTSMNTSIGSNNLFAGSNGTTIGVGQQVSGSSTDFNDTHFTNSSIIIISGSYQVA